MDAEQIVRALAATSPLAFDDQEERGCALCRTSDGVSGEGPVIDLTDPAVHALDCPWRQAREWVAPNDQATANPEAL